jgi:hypothetical protein
LSINVTWFCENDIKTQFQFLEYFSKKISF